MKKAKLVGSYKYKNLRYSKNHPLRIPRVSLLLDFLYALEALEPSEVVESVEASDEDLYLYHTPDYIEALKECDREGRVKKDYREKYNIGTYENPLSPAMWKGSLLATGSTVQAVNLFLEGYLAFNPAGGMHHAYPSKANGFCFLNDPAIALQTLRKKGFKRILYVDLDAHHCDGIQDFYYSTDEVFVLSLHQSPEYAFPFKKGFLNEVGEGKGLYKNMNLPLPMGVNDSEYLYVLERALTLVKEIYKPEVYVLQLGTDTLEEDYLSKFRLSNWGFLRAFKLVREVFGDGVYLGGGGYHPIALARAWALVWLELSGREIPKILQKEAKEVLSSVDFEEFEEETDRSYMYETLLDKPREGEVRKEIKDLWEKLRVTFTSG